MNHDPLHKTDGDEVRAATVCYAVLCTLHTPYSVLRIPAPDLKTQNTRPHSSIMQRSLAPPAGGMDGG